MIENTQVHFTLDPTDLTCNICYYTYGLAERLPISLLCGHSICSVCLPRLNKCSLCKDHIDKSQQYQKNLFISNLLQDLAKQIKCQFHSQPCQGFCYDHRIFICFECLADDHYGHNVYTIKGLNTKADKIIENAGLLTKRKTEKIPEVHQALLKASQTHKRHLEEDYDEEIHYLSLVKKKLFKEVDAHFMSAQEQYEHLILSALNASEPQVKIEDDPEVQFLDIPTNNRLIDQFKAEQAEKQDQLLAKLNNILHPIKNSSDMLQGLLLPSQKSNFPKKVHPHIELEDFIGELQRYNLTVSHQNGLLEVKKANNNTTTTSIPIFNPQYFDCTLTNLSLKCLDILPSSTFLTLCQLLTTIQGLKDLTLEAQRVFDPELASLSHLVAASKTLEKFTVTMDLTCASQSAMDLFLGKLASLRNISSIDITCRGLKFTISLQLNRQQFSTSKELSLRMEEMSEELADALFFFINTFNFFHKRCLKAFRLSLGKNCFISCEFALTQSPKTQFLSALLVQTLIFQSNNLEELSITSEDPNSYLFLMLSKTLPMTSQLKRLNICLSQVSMPSSNLFSRFPQIIHFLQKLEEFSFKIKSSSRLYEDLNELKNFLMKLKALKKLYLQFDGLDFDIFSAKTLFENLPRIQGLVALELEFFNLRGLDGLRLRELENILSRLPSSVNKKCVFIRANLNNLHVID